MNPPLPLTCTPTNFPGGAEPCIWEIYHKSIMVISQHLSQPFGRVKLKSDESLELPVLGINLALNFQPARSAIGGGLVPVPEVKVIFTDKVSIRHPAEAELLEQALQGDDRAVNKVFLYLSSSNPRLRQIMQETIHDIASADLWEHLLSCLGAQCWQEHRDSDRRVDQEASQRIDQSIAKVFVEDEYNNEGATKEAVLHQALSAPQAEIRYAAAYLLGLRGDKQMIPLLEEILETAPKVWKVRAVHALTAIGDERCGPPLIKGLAMDRGVVHAECKKALMKLGPLVEKAWVEALNHPDSHIRWHAARGLGDPKNVRSIQLLAEGLLDENREVRWASADTLARIGPAGIPATLAVISQAVLTTPARQAAYHALHGISSRRIRERLKPLLEALQSPAGSVEAPAIAQRLLAEWEKGH